MCPDNDSRPPDPFSGSAATDPIGNEGAKKLLDLASRKRVRLEDHLAAAGVSQFQPLAEISKEVGRIVFRQFQALPEPVTPPTSGNGNPVTTTF